MAPSTLFLQLVQPINDAPSFATASGNAIFFNYNRAAANSLTSGDISVLTKGGVAAAIADAEAIFINDPAFTSLITETLGVGEDGEFEVRSASETSVVADFFVSANQAFSFKFAATLALEAKEIENPKTEYSSAASKTAFLILDISSVDRPKILDYFGFSGKLISSQAYGALRIGSSHSVTLTSQGETKDVDGDNGVDAIAADVTGDYQRTFRRDAKISIVKINESAIQLIGDTLINRLGSDVQYGTIRRDHIVGTPGADRIYASLGNDWVFGKNGDDILEGGHGRDNLRGNNGNDKLHGGFDTDRLEGDAGDDILVGGHGDDIIVGGVGNDSLTGSEGANRFVFAYRNNNIRNQELDTIQDFETGIDTVEIRGLGITDADAWFNEVVTQGSLVDTPEGASLSLGTNQNVLFAGVSVSSLSGTDFTFV